MNKKLLNKVDGLLSAEKGTVFKDPGGKISIALVYPNTYSVGMSNLGFQGVYGLLNGFGDIVCERVFLPKEDEIIEYRRSGTEIFSFESKRTLARFDIVAFSVSFENDYPNILKILELAHIPARRSGRRSGHPLLIMGGVCAFYNPEPLADFFDIFFVGEAEEMLPEFLSVYRVANSRRDLFEKALGVEGLYLPGYYETEYGGVGEISGRKPIGNAPRIIRKRSVEDISRSAFKPAIISPHVEFSDMYLLEVMRGCPWSCRFCVAGRIYKPVRKKELGALREEINEALRKTERVGLIGPSLSDYPYAEDVLKIEGVDFSITSLRANRRSAAIVGLMTGHKSVSIAPEAGTERLRKVINKKIGEEDIYETARLILSGGIETLRLYFMVGLPTETGEDMEGIVSLVRKVREDSPRGSIILSVSTFVPKPFTPFQWHPMAPLKEIKERLRFIKKGLAGIRNVKVFHDVPKYAYLQGIFARGDRRVSALIEAVAAEGISSISEEAKDFYLFKERAFDEILPWDFIDSGVSKENLWNEYMTALKT